MKIQIVNSIKIILLLIVMSCGANNGNPRSEDFKVDKSSASLSKRYVPKVIRIYPHNLDSYTQGLFFYNDFLFEGTGQYGQSSLLKVDIVTGNILKSVKLSPIFFGEGITLFNGKIFQLTWENQKGFIYNLNTFEKIGEFLYSGEGWGLTCDETYLIMSDGSNFINFLSPDTFELIKTIMVVRNDGSPVYNLNELEFINGLIFANVYMSNEIVMINPTNGKVEGSIDISSLALQLDFPENAEVANGIAYNSKNGHYFITGKYWSNVFEIELIEQN